MTDHYVKNEEIVFEIASASAQQEGACKESSSNSINFECAGFAYVENESGDRGWIREGKNTLAHLVIINERCLFAAYLREHYVE